MFEFETGIRIGILMRTIEIKKLQLIITSKNSNRIIKTTWDLPSITLLVMGCLVILWYHL